MKLFTRGVFFLTALALPVVSAWATTVNVTIGNNFYAPMTVTIQTGDVVNFVWQAGFHPTVSDSPTPQWATFTLSSSDASRALPAFTTPGTYPYHCDAHGAPGSGQHGVIIVQGLATATADSRLAAALVNVFPNPSRGLVTVQVSQKVGADYKLRLSNIIGQEIRTVALRPELTAAGLPLDLSDLHAGMYFYSLLVDGKVVTTKRLVLQN